MLVTNKRLPVQGRGEAVHILGDMIKAKVICKKARVMAIGQP